ncbi:hypothetical protein AMECASPLE_034191 [Ameca splendens]|uniref:Uncharacterized protein n=1 Tax=Ameca splendens TaxID=208324 RepID=A0ABV1A2U2_9TELE
MLNHLQYRLSIIPSFVALLQPPSNPAELPGSHTSQFHSKIVLVNKFSLYSTTSILSVILHLEKKINFFGILSVECRSLHLSACNLGHQPI